MEFRKFYFRNGKGEQIPLNGENGIYASNPSGLGVDRSRTYADLGGGFFSVTYDDSLPMQTPGFKLIFTRRHKQYEDYQNLIRWLAAAGDGLRLVYVPYGGTAYHRKVLIRKITKTDLTRVHWLECPCEVQTLSPWYRPAEYSATLAARAENVMRFPVRYGRERYAKSHAATYSVELTPDGDMPAALSLSFTGAIVNPEITLVGLGSGKTYGSCRVEHTLGAGSTFEWSSNPADSYCRVISGGVASDLFDYMDPDESPFFMLGLEEPCALRLTGDSISGSGVVKCNYFFASV